MGYFTPELINDISFVLAFVAATLFFLLAIIINRKLYREKAGHSKDSPEVLNQRKWLTFFFSAFAIVLLFSPKIVSLNISPEGVGFTTNAQSIADTASSTAEKWGQEKKKNQQLQDELARARQALVAYQSRDVRMARQPGDKKNTGELETSLPSQPQAIEKEEKLYDIHFTGIEIINECEFYNATGEFFWDLKLNEQVSSHRTIADAVKARKNTLIELQDNSRAVKGTEDDYFVISGAVFERDRKEFNTVGLLSEVVSFKEVAQQLKRQDIYDKRFLLKKDQHCEVIVHVSIAKAQLS